MAAGTILSHFSGASVPFWWCSQVRVEKMVFMAVVNYQTQCRRRHRRQKRILKALNVIYCCHKKAMGTTGTSAWLSTNAAQILEGQHKESKQTSEIFTEQPNKKFQKKN